jgi:hypothetical protein
MDYKTSLGEAMRFGKTFTVHIVFFEKNTAINMVLLKMASPIVVLLNNQANDLRFAGAHCADCSSRTVSSETFVGKEFSTLSLRSA